MNRTRIQLTHARQTTIFNAEDLDAVHETLRQWFIDAPPNVTDDLADFIDQLMDAAPEGQESGDYLGVHCIVLPQQQQGRSQGQ